MKRAWLFFIALALPCLSHAETPGKIGFSEVRRCVMQNDPAYCRSILTPDSLPFFERFASYKLMPCLPTDFAYAAEEKSAAHTTVKVTSLAGGGMQYVLRLVFTPTHDGLKLDLPASFARGLGENWQDKIQLSEQLYLMMRRNMGNRLTCDMLNDLVTPK